MNSQIQNSNINDIDEIFRLYKIATEFQKTKFMVHWPEFKKNLSDPYGTLKRGRELELFRSLNITYFVLANSY